MNEKESDNAILILGILLIIGLILSFILIGIAVFRMGSVIANPQTDLLETTRTIVHIKESWTDLPELNVTGNYSQLDVCKIIYDRWGYNFNLIPVDREYNTTTKENIEQFLEWDRTEYINTQEEYFDCDDRAMRLYGQMCVPPWSSLSIDIGIFTTKSNYSGTHMVCIFIDDNQTIWKIEPNDVDEIPDHWKPKEILI